MANKVTGSNDTSGALSIAPSTPKSIMIIGKTVGEPTNAVDANKIVSLTGTSDAAGMFGSESVVVKMVKLLISNGVDNIYAIIADVPEKGSSSDEEYQKLVEGAYDKALTASIDEDSVKVLLLDTNKQTSLLKTHLALCETNDMFRYSVILPDNDTNTQDTLVKFAKGIDDSRIFTSGPAMIDTSAKDVDPVLGAAGIAAMIMTETNDPALPLNGVRIKGLSGVNRKMLDTEKQVLVKNGVTPLYTEGSMPNIFRLVTTCVSDPVWQEGTTRFIADYVLETVENTLRANYKRTKNVARVLGDTGIRGTVKTILQTMEDLEIIENFDESTLTVIKDPKDQYGALVDYEIDVVTPLYTITISQHIKL